MKPKTVLFLGAAVFQIPPIRYALGRGYRIVTLDNHPENPGHRFADKNYFVSTTDRNAVLRAAARERVDGILSYGSDVSMPAAAYAADTLGLAGPGLEAVLTLVHKGRFRELLRSRGLQDAGACRTFARGQRKSALSFVRGAKRPLIVKPVDSSGSKGVTRLADARGSVEAVDFAYGESSGGGIIIEDCFEGKGRQVCGDGFVQNGRIVFFEPGDGFFHGGAHPVPWGELFPGGRGRAEIGRVRRKAEAALRAARFRQGVFNLDAMIGADGRVFIVEIGPRNGGNFLDDAIFRRTGVDLTEAAVENCLDRRYRFRARRRPARDAAACYLAHSRRPGVLRGVVFSRAIRDKIVRYTPYLAPGSRVEAFHAGNRAVGHLLLNFKSRNEALKFMPEMGRHCRVRFAR